MFYMFNMFRGLSAILVLMLVFSVQAQIVINEVDADQTGTDAQEFVELYGPPGTALNGMVLVFFNGSTDLSYNSVDLDGQTLDANGFFVYGSTLVPNVDLDAGAVTNLIQNGQDAVALYTGDDVDFPSGTAVTTLSLIDALVYDTNDADDAGLLVLTPGQAQINEDGGIDKDIESNSRFPDGGTALVTSTYAQQTPTPGDFNSPVVASAVVNTQVLINGDSTGQATASGAGGTAPYTYLWDDVAVQTTAIATGLAAGIYTVTVTDSTGTNSDTAMVTITEPTVLTSTSTVTDETSVGANDGTASVVAAGGVGPYTYLWSNGATTATITGLAPGSYTVVITDNNGATSSPAAPSVIVAALPPAIIPTLNQYMMMLLMLLIGLVAIRRVKA